MKSMKKSMFVTTILMVVLLIVALSTATFAWYTANANVGSAKYKVTSASSSSASLVIDNTLVVDPNASGVDYTTVTLAMSGAPTGIQPMVYTDVNTSAVAPVVDETTYSQFIGRFKTFTADSAGNFASPVTAGTPATLTSVTGHSGSGTDDIVVTNVGGASIATNGLTATITLDQYDYVLQSVTVGTTVVTGLYTKSGDEYTLVSAENTKAAAETDYYKRTENTNLCVAIFAGASDAADADLVLKGIKSNRSSIQIASSNIGSVNAAAVSAGTSISSTVGAVTMALNSDAIVLNTTAAVASMAGMKVKVVAWFEGVGMTNSIAGTSAWFSISFAG